MSSDIRILKAFFSKNRLTMDTEKTMFMIFTTRNSSTVGFLMRLYWVRTVYKYLGLWIDNKLDFSDHIRKIRRCVSQILGVLRRIRPYVIDEILDSLYVVSCVGLGHGIKRENYWSSGASEYRFEVSSATYYLFPTRQLYSNRIFPVVMMSELEMLLSV
jgi:hypothetical protein